MLNNNCCLCGKDIIGYGHNSAPLRGGNCCDNCNDTLVLPFRIYMMNPVMYKKRNPEHLNCLLELKNNPNKLYEEE